MARMACTFIGMDWGLRACLDMVITSSLPRMALVRFIECACYDETPLRMQASQSLQSALAAPTDTSSEALTQAVGRAISCLGPESRVTRGSAKSSGVQKLVQTQVEFGCLVRIGSKLVTFIGHQVCPLAIVQRATASVFAHLQQRLSLTSRMALLFRRCTRSAVTDSYSAIVAAERQVAADRRAPMDQVVHMKCQVHKTSTCHGLTFSFDEPEITGLIRCALALRSGSSMIRFKECIDDEIRTRLEILEGAPDRGAIAYRRNIIKTFVNHGSMVLARRLLLAVLPKWRLARAASAILCAPRCI